MFFLFRAVTWYQHHSEQGTRDAIFNQQRALYPPKKITLEQKRINAVKAILRNPDISTWARGHWTAVIEKLAATPT